MQSKPGAPYVFYICNDGITIDDKANMNWGITCMANSYDTDGTYIWFGPLVQQPDPWINVVNFPAANYPDINRIWERVAKKYEIFNVNVTTEKSVFLATPNENRRLCILVRRPTSAEMSAAKYLPNSFVLNRSEDGPLPYSFRRWLIGVMKKDPTSINSFIFDGAGFAMSWYMQYLSKLANNYIACIAFVNQSYARFTPFQGRWSDSLRSLSRIDVDLIGSTAAHEFGHLLKLNHDTAKGGDPTAGDPNSYYRGHGVWAPIMGSADMLDGERIDQWAIDEYSANNNPEDDIKIIADQIDFIKPPCRICDDKSAALERFANLKDNECWEKELGYNVRVITKDDLQDSYIEGMIGFPYDFDLLKFILPKGSYKFKIDNIPTKNLGSMLDPQIDIINCHCNQSKEDLGVSCDQSMLPAIYPQGTNVQCIAYDSCLSKNEYTVSKNFGEEDGFRTVIASVDLAHRSIVYVRIRGGKDQTPDTGWSRYGSVGKYKLQITKDENDIQNTDMPSQAIPECHCEEFDYCKDGSEEKILLYIQDENEPKGTNNKAEAHIEELSAIINGESVSRKFLVYGEPIALDAQEEEGKFYLNVVIDGQCKKQEFVVGSDWEKKKN